MRRHRAADPALARGFTLFEVLIAVAVLGMLLLLLNQGFAFGLRAAATQVRAEVRQGDMDAADRALRQLVASADPGTAPEPASLKGSAATLTMVTTLPPDATGRRQAIDAALLLAGDELRLRWTLHRHVAPFGPMPRPQETVVLAGVQSAAFAYFDGKSWRADWGAERLPALVRITLGFRDPARHWPPIEVAPVREAVPQ